MNCTSNFIIYPIINLFLPPKVQKNQQLVEELSIFCYDANKSLILLEYLCFLL